MAQSTDSLAGLDAPTRDEERPEPLTFTLQVVSPSVGVSSPLSFPHLAATTTVKELKAKIRDALPLKPTDDHQRLIHRGRMLGRETETMLDVFGQETLANPESQTLHLVLRPSASDGPSTHPTPAVAPVIGPQPVTANPLLPQGFPALAQQFQPRPQSTPAIPNQGMHAQQPLPGFQQVQQHQLLHQYEHMQNVMAQRLQQLQRETQRLHQEMTLLEQRTRTQGAPGSLFNGQQQNPLVPPQGLFRPPPAVPATLQNLINQQQRERAAEGRQGVQDTGATPFGPAPPASGRASPNVHRPDHTTTYTREGIGPNGERWHMTVNETTTTLPFQQPHHHHHAPSGGQASHTNANPALDIQAVLRNADRFLASQNTLNNMNMQRSASNPAPGTSQASSSTPAPVATETSAMPTPATTTSSPSASTLLNPALNPALLASNTNPQAAASGPNPPSEPVVYILSSPTGPRALLVSNTDTYFTPRQHSRRHSPAAANGQAQAGAPIGLPEFRNRPAHRANAAARRAQVIQQGNPLEPVPVPHANPGAGALAAQIGPLLWLVVRLVAFVWFFTAGNPSWSRWLMVCALALVVFIVNTGIFNGVFERAWGPIRRHLENLIPLAGPDAALVPAANAAVPQAGAAAPAENGNPQRRRRHGELDEAEVAARLIEQRRQANNGGWLIAQIRRAEHSLLLFLASLVPGVGERHIAAREAEANAAEAERQRQIEAANAAETAEADNAAEGAATTVENGNRQENQENEANGAANIEETPAQPLVEV